MRQGEFVLAVDEVYSIGLDARFGFARTEPVALAGCRADQVQRPLPDCALSSGRRDERTGPPLGGVPEANTGKTMRFTATTVLKVEAG